MASTKDASVIGVINPQLAYTIDGAARVMGTTPRWIKDTLLKPGLIPYTQATPRSPIFIAGRNIIDWIEKGDGPRPQQKQQAGSGKQKTDRTMSASELELLNLTGILTGDQIAELYIRSEKADSAKRKLNGWLNGYRFLGGREVPLNVPLRHFIDGKTILVRLEWLIEFIEGNSEHLANDPTRPNSPNSTSGEEYDR